jgi:ABC-type multidrug transport system, ATPase component
MLEIRNLSKSYGKKVALNNINLKFDNGLYGLLGPNGAGKSTLMNIITDNLKADNGEILWNGMDYQKLGVKYREILGYMPQQQGLYNGFTGKRFLNYIAVLKDIPKKEILLQIEESAKKVNLQNELDKKINMYSGGMKQRLLIASCILGNPKLIIFDEPTAGLDPKERVRVKKLMQELSSKSIVIIATHIVPDIENIAKEIVILKEGVLIEKNTPEKLIEKYAPNGDLEDVYMNIFENKEENSFEKNN